MAAEPRISAVVCTLGRPVALARALASLAAQTLPASDYEILVVDNGGGSGGHDGVAPTRPGVGVAGPPIRSVREPRRGLSIARNTGVAHAAGEVVAFLDDDATASPTWLERILAAFAGAFAPACVGGPVAPVFEAPRPSWFPDALLGYLSVVDLAERPFRLGERHWLAGTNIAFDRRRLLEAGGFSPCLGRTPGTLLGMEEVAVQRALRRRGHAVIYDPAVLVHHHIPAERLTRRWLHRRAYWQGVSDAIADREDGRRLIRAAQLVAHAGGLLLHPLSLASAALPLPAAAARTTAECAALLRAGYLLAQAR